MKCAHITLQMSLTPLSMHACSTNMSKPLFSTTEKCREKSYLHKVALAIFVLTLGPLATRRLACRKTARLCSVGES